MQPNVLKTQERSRLLIFAVSDEFIVLLIVGYFPYNIQLIMDIPFAVDFIESGAACLVTLAIILSEPFL